MDEPEYVWEWRDEWHPMFRMHLASPELATYLSQAYGWHPMDYTEYWAGQRDADGLPEVWQ